MLDTFLQDAIINIKHLACLNELGNDADVSISVFVYDRHRRDYVTVY